MNRYLAAPTPMPPITTPTQRWMMEVVNLNKQRAIANMPAISSRIEEPCLSLLSNFPSLTYGTSNRTTGIV